MKGKISFITLCAAAALLVLALAACGGSAPATVNDLPAYPGASELKAGSSTIGDTLAKNMQTDAGLRQAIGSGGKTEQKGFTLPKGTAWDAVKKFYDDKLKAAGWGEPNSMVSNVLAQVNQSNDAFQTATYTRGNQTLAVIRLVDPISNEVTLILSLSTR